MTRLIDYQREGGDAHGRRQSFAKVQLATGNWIVRSGSASYRYTILFGYYHVPVSSVGLVFAVS